MNLKRLTLILYVSASALAITACGGGDGESATPTPLPTATPPADNGAEAALQSLQGSWFSTCEADGFGGSERIRFLFENSRQTVSVDTFSDPSCTTATQRKATSIDTADINVGDTIITSSGVEARKLDVTFDPDANGSRDQLLTIFTVDQNGQRLLVGDADSLKDQDGRDTALDFDLPFSVGTPPPPMQSGNNSRPLVIAGDDFSAPEGSTVMFEGLAGDAEDEDDQLRIMWTQLSGPVVTLLNETSLTPSFEAPPVQSTQVLVFRLTATDSAGASDSDDISVSVIVDPCILDPDGDFACALRKPVRPPGNDGVQGTLGIDTPDEADFYLLSLQAGQKISFSSDNGNSPSTYECFLYDANRSVLIDKFCNVFYEITETGDYFFAVKRGPEGRFSDGYRVSFFFP